MGIAALFTMLTAMVQSLASAQTQQCCFDFQDARCLACLLQVPVEQFCAKSPTTFGCIPSMAPTNAPTVDPTEAPSVTPTEDKLQALESKVDELTKIVDKLSAQLPSPPTALPSEEPTLSPTKISDTVPLCKTIEITKGNAAELSQWWAVADDEALRNDLPVWRNMAKTGLIYSDGSKWMIEEDDGLVLSHTWMGDRSMPPLDHQIWSVQNSGDRTLASKIVVEITCSGSLVTAAPSDSPTVSPTTSNPSQAPTRAPTEVSFERVSSEYSLTSNTNVNMTPHANSFCFLTYVRYYKWSSYSYWQSCRISQIGSYWRLEASNAKHSGHTYCYARCVTFA